MLASENPYDWNSCYRLEPDNSCSHADGCLAAILDTSSLITYVWSREGQYNLNDRFEFKSIRYKKMREWIALSKNLTTIHFNQIYPTKNNTTEELERQLRVKVEKLIANYLGIPDLWKRNDDRTKSTRRNRYYGYGEFASVYMFYQSDSEIEDIEVYNRDIECPCGCGVILDGSDEGLDYDGYGFHHDCYDHRYFCELSDDYCDNECCCSEYCEGCRYWEMEHPVCSLDTCEECSNPDSDYISDDGIMEANECHCSDCPIWESCHAPDDEEE
jgi:hypothetical protein